MKDSEEGQDEKELAGRSILIVRMRLTLAGQLWLQRNELGDPRSQTVIAQRQAGFSWYIKAELTMPRELAIHCEVEICA